MRFIDFFAGVGGFRCGLNKVELKNDTVIENGDWNFAFTDLDPISESLEEIEYSIAEEPVEGYESVIETDEETGAFGKCLLQFEDESDYLTFINNLSKSKSPFLT